MHLCLGSCNVLDNHNFSKRTKDGSRGCQSLSLGGDRLSFSMSVSIEHSTGVKSTVMGPGRVVGSLLLTVRVK